MTKKKKINIDFKSFMLNWNSKYPFDRYIRQKHGLPFGSPQHLQLNPIDSALEFAEDLLLKQSTKKTTEMDDYKNIDLNTLETKQGEENQENKVVKMSKKEVLQAYENLDISEFND